MTIKDLKKMIIDLPDDTLVIIPLNAGDKHNGEFLSPCLAESGVREFVLEDLPEEEIKERKLLNKPLDTEYDFALVPCGYFEEHEKPVHNLN